MGGMKKMGLFDLLTKSFSEKEVDKLQPTVKAVLALEPKMQSLSDDELRAMTPKLKERFQNGESLNELLPEAFALVREAAFRVLQMKPYPVQVLGGIVLHQGRIAEMKTGEGKTLAATMPAYLNALEGKGVHIVTVNDYLATRDSEWMGKVYEFLGLRVGCILQDMTTEERQTAYNADITYGTNNQFGFDYLRDNMAIYNSSVVQRSLHYAIVDEVDSILIDEARTPLIISGQGDPSTEMYSRADHFVTGLEGRLIDPNEEESKLDSLMADHPLETVDYVVDKKRHSANLTERGSEKAEKAFGVENIADPSHMELMHYINQALKARTLMQRDIDYVVVDGEVKIVDEFTGRIMEGRRYSDGLHQAIEAKEGVEIKSESKTLATITFQNFFLMYDKLSGMTGTAMTEKDEFSEIYHLDVVEIPTNKPMIRNDRDDVVFKTQEGKFSGIVDEIKRVYASGQPILVGTEDIETSEHISRLLKKERIPHSVLNAKQHAKEAAIVAQAGRYETVTIATNMAGRGTDIVLGGNPEWMAKKEMSKKGYSEELIGWADSFRHVEPIEKFPVHLVNEEEEGEGAVSLISGQEILDARKLFQDLKAQFAIETKENAQKVVDAGGLYILGTARSESRRVDNQLRGRSGRQGDPGESRFYIALDDKLMYLYGGEKMRQLSESDMFPDDQPIEAKMLTKSIEMAQKRVESNNFATRKRVLDFDNVMNVQRKTIYSERNRVLNGENMKEYITEMIHSVISDAVDSFCAPDSDAQHWEVSGLSTFLDNLFIPEVRLNEEEIRSLSQPEVKNKIIAMADQFYQEKEKEMGTDVMRELERIILLRSVDTRWMDHIDAMEQLRQEINVRAYGNDDPVRAYANEGFEMFSEMNDNIRQETVRLIYHVVPASKMERTQVARGIREGGAGADASEQGSGTYVRKNKKIGRNDPCPCGSGKKYKNCHGKGRV